MISHPVSNNEIWGVAELKIFFKKLSAAKLILTFFILVEIEYCLAKRWDREPSHSKWWKLPELQRIIRIIRYSNSWDRIVLFVFGIRSICDFRIIFEYPNSCHRIPNSSRIFYKQDMCRKHSKKPSCKYENKGSKCPHLIFHKIHI